MSAAKWREEVSNLVDISNLGAYGQAGNGNETEMEMQPLRCFVVRFCSQSSHRYQCFDHLLC